MKPLGLEGSGAVPDTELYGRLNRPVLIHRLSMPDKLLKWSLTAYMPGAKTTHFVFCSSGNLRGASIIATAATQQHLRVKIGLARCQGTMLCGLIREYSLLSFLYLFFRISVALTMCLL